MNSFKTAVNRLIESGNFLDFTRRYELSIPEAQTIRLKGCTAQLLETGVLLIEPEDPSCSDIDIVISSGIHGNETAPIEIVDQLVREIFGGNTEVRNRTLFIIGNPVSMNLGQRFKAENLNRLFSGKFKNYPGTYEGERAEKLEQLVENFFKHNQDAQPNRIHYDLHTAIRDSKYKKFVVIPYQKGKTPDKRQLEFFKASGVTTMLLAHAPSGTFSCYSSHTFGASAFTVELGKVRPFGENDMPEFQAITDNLRLLIRGKTPPVEPYKEKDFIFFRVLRELTKYTDEFKLFIDDDVENFTELPVGFLLSEDGDRCYITQQKGESLIFPNPKVKNGQRVGLIVVRTKI